MYDPNQETPKDIYAAGQKTEKGIDMNNHKGLGPISIILALLYFPIGVIFALAKRYK